MSQAHLDLKAELTTNLQDIILLIEEFLEKHSELTTNNVALLQSHLSKTFPMNSKQMLKIRSLLRKGTAENILCDREHGGVRFSRLLKSVDGKLSIDLVHMNSVGPGHTHPKGEIDLSFIVSDQATFDQKTEGFLVYPANSWHKPTVTNGRMDIIYFLPEGAIRFEEKPSEK